MISDLLALGAGANRMVEVQAAIPQGVPKFIGQFIELLVVEGAGLIDDDQVKVRAGAELPSGEGTDRSEADTGIGHAE